MSAGLPQLVERLRDALGPPVGDVPDGELLGRFARDRDQTAFAELVRRRGPLVLGVCGRVLRDRADAEDAFQATFLVLARKAGRIRRPDQLANWLFGVAARVARAAGRRVARRRRVEVAVGTPPDRPGPAPDGAPADWRDVLYEEVGRLPAHYRAAVLLCDLEGRPRREAARSLGIPDGTLSNRLARARALLGRRLLRRGVGPGGLLVTAAVPQPLVGATVAAVFAATPPAPIASLATEACRTMTPLRLLMASAVVCAAAAVGFGGLPAEPPAAPAPSAATPKLILKPPAWKACFTVTHTAAVTAVAAADDMVAVADAESRLRLWDPADGHELGLRVYGVPGNCPIGTLRFTTKAKYLVAECPPWAITRFDRLADRLRGGTFTGLWHGVAWSRDLDTVVCRRPHEPPDRLHLHNDLWNDPNGRLQPRAVVGPWDGVKVKHVALAADKPLLAVAGDDGVVRLIATDPVAERRVIEPGPQVKSRTVKVKLRAIALSDDGGRLAVVGDGGFAAVFDPATGKPVCPLGGHTGPVTKVTFDPAGKRVVTACGKTARVFDATTGRVLGEASHQDDVTAVAFSTDGKRLVTGSADKTATVWEPTD